MYKASYTIDSIELYRMYFFRISYVSHIYKFTSFNKFFFRRNPFTLRWVILHVCRRKSAMLLQDLAIGRTLPRRVTSDYCEKQKTRQGFVVRPDTSAKNTPGGTCTFPSSVLYSDVYCRSPFAWNFFASRRDEYASRYATRRQEYTSSAVISRL